MTQFLTLVVTGLVTGAIFSLIATCLTLTYQSTGIFNLGYGAVAYISAFVFYLLHIGGGWPTVPSAILVVVVFGVGLGWALDRYVFRLLSTASESSKIMATVGVLVFLPAAGLLVEQIINGLGGHLPDTTQVAEAPGLGPAPPITWKIGTIPITSDELIVFVLAAVVALGMWLLMQHSRYGLRMRMLVDRPNLAELRGVNRARTSSVAWMIGTALASLAGMAAAPVFNSLNANAYNVMMFVAIAAVVVGAFRSIPIAFAAGLVLGIFEALVARYATFAQQIAGFNSAVPFVVLLVGVALWGRSRSRAAGATAESEVTVDHSGDLSRLRRALPWGISIVVLCVFTGFIANDFWVNQVTEGLAFGIVFLSFVIVTGLGGMVSLAQAAFVSASGLTAGLMIDHFHVPWIAALLIGTAIAGLLGLIVALPALRLGGLALALATLAFGFLGDNVLFQWSWLSNGTTGWTIPRPGFLANTRVMAVVLLVVVGLVVLAVRNLQRSAAGRAAISMNSSDAAARMVGISPTMVTLFIFWLSALLAGFGGVLLTTYTSAVGNQSFLTAAGLTWLASVVLWGIRRPGAAVIAGLSVALFPAFISGGFHFGFISWTGDQNVYIPSALFGLGAIQMAQDPNGILNFTAARNRHKRAKRAATRGLAVGLSDAAIEKAQLDVVDDHALEEATHGHGIAVPPGSPTEGPSSRPLAAPACLAIEDVSAGYGEIEVLNGISLRLDEGTITALVGANGAGKSTLCGVVSGLVPLTAGRLVYRGADITLLATHDRSRHGITLVPEARGIFPGASVEDNLMLLLPKQKDRAEVYERFPQLGERRKIPAGSLSGGEQQMLALGPLLVAPPDLLVADEPTLGLAPIIAAEIMRLFAELRDKGVTMLIVEERANQVLDLADTVAVIELGWIVWAGPPTELRHEDLVSAFLGGPASRAAEVR